MTAGMIAPQWMHELVTAEQYDSRSPELCAGIIFTCVLDPAVSAYRDSDVHTGSLTTTAPFDVDLDLRAV